MRETLLDQIRTLHIEIEQQLQHIGQITNQPHCATCTSVCCQEHICRESVESAFLRFILGDRAQDYDAEAGWFAPGKGCQLDYGRPLLCYEYFCLKFSAEELERSHASVAREFRAIYAKTWRGQHMLTIDDLNEIPETRLQRIVEDLAALRERMAASAPV
ncbi:hypothetical protein [Cerasicoccus fimbriatus]|uniref:hypothetical protein n=1 Tax=Cerasicoccus fimbriatus TaxID=3014554 RepID=UPI0022B4F97F|nr:hypothetical protein [Cerasicoccus sp. TK19100]